MEPFSPALTGERFHRVLRTRSWLLDGALAVLVVLVGTISRPGLSFATPTQAIYTVIILGCAAPLIFRRRRPRSALSVVAVLLLVHLIAAIPPGIGLGLICLIVAYTTQTQLTAPWRQAFLTAVCGGAVAAIWISPLPSGDLGPRGRLIATAVVLGLLTLAVLAGVVRRQRRARYTHAIDRARMLEERRNAERRLAAVEERTRIAREMHDILGHSLTAIAAQAEGARYVLRSDADRADQALGDIGLLSRRAVDDVRDLIDVLAPEEAEEPVRQTSSLSDIPELIASLQYTRAAIRLWVDGDVEAVPAHVGPAVYRIVQESLTNALKHADGAAISVRITVEPHQVRLTVANTFPPAVPRPRTGTGGRGIIGMRERARALGGTVEAGPDPTTGGWRVSVVLPWSHS